MQVPEWHPVTRWCRVARVDPPSPENRYKYSTVVSSGMVPGRLFGVAFLASLAVAEFGEYGEEGVTDVDGNFIPGASGIYSQKCSRELYLVNMRALTFGNSCDLLCQDATGHIPKQKTGLEYTPF